MSWTTQYFPNGAALRYEGTTTGDDIYRSKIEVFAHDFPSWPRFLLCDFTLVDNFSVNPKDVDRLAELYRRAARTIGDFAIAVVAPDPHEYGLARMWEISIESSGFRTSVVHTRPEAIRWLDSRGIRPLPDAPLTRRHSPWPDDSRDTRRHGEA